MKNLLIVVMCIFIACATAYKRDGFTGGYSELQLDENVFSVSFKGNGFTNSERAEDFALLRCAELAIENGYNFFIIIDSKSYVSRSTYTTPTTSKTKGTASWSGYNRIDYNETTKTKGGETYIISKPSQSNTIVCFVKKPEGFSYTAAYVYNGLAQKYNIQKTHF